MTTGLDMYAFQIVQNSPYLAKLNVRNALSFPDKKNYFGDYIHFVATFHDETLEVIAKTGKYLGRAHALTGLEAIQQYAI